MDQPGKVANPARDQLNRENSIPLSPCVPENLVSRDGFSRPVPRQPAHLHTQAESGAYLRDSSRVPRRCPFMKPPYAIGSVPSLSGHAIAYRWSSLPRVRRHRASKPQGSSERVLPWQITMDQLIFASLFHTHYWYEVGMLKVPAVSLDSHASESFQHIRTDEGGSGRQWADEVRSRSKPRPCALLRAPLPRALGKPTVKSPHKPRLSTDCNKLLTVPQ